MAYISLFFANTSPNQQLGEHFEGYQYAVDSDISY